MRRWACVCRKQVEIERDRKEEAQQRLELAKAISALMYGGDQAAVAPDALMKTLQECVDEGCVSEQLAQAMMSGSFASTSASARVSTAASGSAAGPTGHHNDASTS